VLIPLTLVWAVMTLAALSFVFVFGSNAPYADEWEFIPALLDQEPLPSWLWAQHNEHRLPLSRAIYYILFQLTHDFRAGMYLQIAMLSALALGLMGFSAHLRGRSDWVDAFFPVSLLHVGHWENFVMGYQLCFALFCCLVSLLAVVAFQAKRETAFRSGLWAVLLLSLTALTGGFGLAVVPPVASWLFYLAVLVWSSGAKAKSLILLILAALPVIYLAIYFEGYQRPPGHPPFSDDPLTVGIVTGEVLAMAFGIGVSGLWWLVASVEVVVGVATTALLLRQGRTPTNRPASFGLIAVAAGVFGLALAIGFSRGSMGDGMGLWPRYALLVWPLVGTAFLVWVRAGRRWLPILFCMTTALAFMPNMFTGMLRGATIRAHYNQIESDVRSGLSTERIIANCFPNSVNEGQTDRAVAAIPLLRNAGIGVLGAARR
jgi:hypothetical protein